MNKKMRIGDRIYDVTSLEDYTKHKDAYMSQYTAIHDPVTNLVLPIKNRYDSGPGIVVGNGVSYVDEPSENINDYDGSSIIDFDNSKSIHDMMEKQRVVRSLERDILTSPDNIFTPKIFDDDSPEMKALKTAVLEKQIDLDKYEPRFGSNYNNDKRLFNKNTISLSMTKRVCDALDIKATLILEDKNPDVPNPIGRTIKVELTGGVPGDE
jgi:hypothetical protein